jgi:hypothetical protein
MRKDSSHPGRRNRDDDPGSDLAAPETLLETMQRDLEAWTAAKAAIEKARSGAPSAG